MAIYRITHKEKFTVVDNRYLRDPRLSLDAIAVHTYILSCADTWDITIGGIASVLAKSKAKIRKAIAELEDHGYCHRQQIHDAKGRIKYEYDFFEVSRIPYHSEATPDVSPTAPPALPPAVPPVGPSEGSADEASDESSEDESSDDGSSDEASDDASDEFWDDSTETTGASEDAPDTDSAVETVPNTESTVTAVLNAATPNAVNVTKRNNQKKSRYRRSTISVSTSKRHTMIPPTLEEVEAYCREFNSVIDPQRFYDYYVARGWRCKGAAITDWHALVRVWASREYPTTKGNESHHKASDMTDSSENDDFFDAALRNAYGDDLPEDYYQK